MSIRARYGEQVRKAVKVRHASSAVSGNSESLANIPEGLGREQAAPLLELLAEAEWSWIDLH
jgi:hypothetical protein